MKKLLIINTLVSSLFCFTQSTNQKNNTEQEIRKLMKDWMIAVMKKDEKTLNKIVAPEFKLDDVYHSFPPVARKTWMENAMIHLKVDSVHYYDMRVNVIDNVAIVDSRFYWAGKFGDRPPFVERKPEIADLLGDCGIPCIYCIASRNDHSSLMLKVRHSTNKRLEG